ncbi:hypothetical protein PG996_006045 [Apiospora saccharicola]|uniref:Uncharacterized protein n=1 Tax=Apiospora saccharicola TaxID=335842 RepID=A0ABR1VPA7_9PEZI
MFGYERREGGSLLFDDEFIINNVHPSKWVQQPTIFAGDEFSLEFGGQTVTIPGGWAYRNIKDYRSHDPANHYDVAIVYIQAFGHVPKLILKHLKDHKRTWFIYEHPFNPVFKSGGQDHPVQDLSVSPYSDVVSNTAPTPRVEDSEIAADLRYYRAHGVLPAMNQTQVDEDLQNAQSENLRYAVENATLRATLAEPQPSGQRRESARRRGRAQRGPACTSRSA